MKADNYNISTEEGTLTVFPSTAASLAAEGYTGKYDGQSHDGVTSVSVVNAVEGLDWTYTYSTDGETYTDEMPQFKDAGTYTVHVKATNPNYEDLYATVTVEISPREVTLTSATDSKTYDGTPLTNHNVSVGGDGFVEVKESGIAKSLSVCTVSGNATVSGYRTEEFGIHSVSGTTSVTGISGKGSVSATSGNVNLSYAEWDGDLNISLISGNVNVELPADSGMDLSFSGVSGMLKTDLGREKGSFMNLGKGTNGEFGGANKHKVSASLTSGTVTVSQR